MKVDHKPFCIFAFSVEALSKISQSIPHLQEVDSNEHHSLFLQRFRIMQYPIIILLKMNVHGAGLLMWKMLGAEMKYIKPVTSPRHHALMWVSQETDAYFRFLLYSHENK